MALRTPETTDEQNAAHNKSQEYYDKKFQDIAAREQNESIPGYDRKRDGLDDHPISAGDASGEDPNENISDIKDKESSAGGWKTDLSGRGVYGDKAFERGRPLSFNNVKAILKKKGPLGLLTVILLGGGIGVASFLPALLPIHVLESLVNKYDTQNTSMTIRTNKLIASKISNMATEGYCNTVKIACRFSRPSNYQLTQFEKNGIRALDAKGNPIEKNGLFPNTRPAQYEFTDGSGKKLPPIKASEFSIALRDNAQLRAAFHSAYNPRYVGYADSVFKAIQARFGFSKKNILADAKDNADATNKINEEAKGAKKVSGAADAAESEIKPIIADEAKKEVKKITDAGKGNAVGLVAGGACLIGDVPGLVTKTVRVYQMGQLIKYSMVFLAASSAIKAGDAKSGEASVIGDLLTSVVAGKSAMDSFGMKYTLFGDTSASSDNYKKFSPGASAIAALGNITRFTSSTFKKQTCDFATNPLTGAAIDVATSETVILPLINTVAALGISAVVENLAPPLIDLVMPLIPTKALLNFFLGDLTQNLSGVDAGNALVSGASNMMSQTANAGGNVPLTVDQAIAYTNTTKQVQLAYAEEDRATHSPLDATNQNTMVGSMVNQILPYYGNVNTFADILGSTGSILTGSFRSLLPSAGAATIDKAQYSQCEDPAIKDGNIAAGPFCNIINGIPPQYLDEDPQVIVDKFTASGDINPDDGEPVEGKDLQKWVSLCTDGATDQLANCKITDQTTAEYALYTIDHRIQKTMDNMDTSPEGSAATTASTSTSGTGAVSGTAIKGDDYPYGKGPIDIASPLGYMTRECVDFVAWRLNEQSGITSAPFKFGGYGNASTWRDTARINGYTVDKKPTLGSVAWWGPMVSAVLTAGPLGHVAIVSAVNDDGSIIIEQYNGLFPGHTYSQYTLPASAVAKLEFLHIADIK